MPSLAISRRSFHPSPALTVAALVVAGLLSSLGYWQHRRAIEKEALAARLEERAQGPVLAVPATVVDPEAMQYRRVSVRGHYDAERTVLVDNKVHRGVAGYRVVTPLKIEGGERYVLIDRGWIAAGPDRAKLPSIAMPAGAQVVEGIAVVPSARFIELAPDLRTGPVRQNLVIDKLQEELRIPLQPIVIEQISGPADGLVRQLERPDGGADRHRAYSLQWYAMALVAVVFYVLLGFRHAGPRPRG
jgi:surfeit locus 1 family protein